MEVVGFSASILTFVGAAITVSKSIHNTLSAIKHGPEIIASLSHEISQLETILQRLSELFSTTATPADRPGLEQLVEKCKNDLVEFETTLRQLDVSGADGRRGRLWRKVKFCLGEKDLDQMRHVVRGHFSVLTIHLGIVQAQQAPLSTDILSLLQEVHQGVLSLQVSNASAVITQDNSFGTSPRVLELDDTQSDISQQSALDDTVARLMKLLEKKPCVVESDDSKEIVDDLERLLQFVQDEVLAERDKDKDVSSEVKLFTSLIVSAPSLRINQNGPMSSFGATKSQVAISQERKRKELHANDAVITVATTKRRERVLFVSEDSPADELYGREFRGSLTLKSKTKKKMVTLSVQQGQLLFDRFTSLLPRVIVCNILPNDSPVFEVASTGSVEDLMRLIVESKASLDDHDEDGWSLLHHAVGNLPTLKFLVQQGLDATEIAEDKPRVKGQKTDPLSIANDYDYDISFSEILLHAGADPTIELEGHALTLFDIMTDISGINPRNLLHQALVISPFVLPGTPVDSANLLYGFGEAWVSIPGEVFNLEQERKTLDILVSRGYDVNAGNPSSGLCGFFKSEKRSFSKALERRDLLIYLMSRGADPFDLGLPGSTPSYEAYGSMCKPCYMSKSSLMGDLWDTILDLLGYDIASFRQDYPRIASYKNGYTREIFEELWKGREEHCPYWDDETWPKFSNKEVQLDFESKLDRSLCGWCELCFDGSWDSPSCGPNLLVFRYLCHEKLDPDHEHHYRCPRIQVGYIEECENCGHIDFRPKVDSDPDLDDGRLDYSNLSDSSNESGFGQSPLHRWVTECCYCRFQEISSDDESVGGAEL
uniref:WGS project CBMI000000000 data, contig CS3069_c002932 n=1 Tax=Fusarium clavum TaxID=2594811 RepID=A0A090MDB7_9HYPO|nr:unnamed protein product [Fusarium clavum]